MELLGRLPGGILPISLVASCLYFVISSYLNYRKAPRFPGPFLAKISNAWLLYHTVSGRLDQVTSAAIREYGMLVWPIFSLPKLKPSRLTSAHCP